MILTTSRIMQFSSHYWAHYALADSIYIFQGILKQNRVKKHQGKKLYFVQLEPQLAVRAVEPLALNGLATCDSTPALAGLEPSNWQH